MTKITENSACPCSSGQSFKSCCKPYLNGLEAPTPETLMRSRYSAYATGEIDYIQKTMRGPALEGFDPIEAKEWSTASKWQALEIIAAPPVSEGDQISFVSFRASYLEKNLEHVIEEKSEFRLDNGRWYYFTNHPLETQTVKQVIRDKKVGRNESCPCGSGKKYKKCCLLSNQ